MRSKSTAALLLVFLITVLAYVYRPYWEPLIAGEPTYQPPLPPQPLVGTNTISGLKVERDAQGRWFASYDYFYTGKPPNAHLQVYLVGNYSKANASVTKIGIGGGAAKQGQQHLRTELLRPIHGGGPFETTQVIVELQGGAIQPVAASQTLAHVIPWPDSRTADLDRDFATKTKAEAFERAVALIDEGDGDSLFAARYLLNRLLGQDAKFDAAYVELARVSMKSNWGPEGLHQAENYLSSALGIRPDSADAKILLGYVYAHQQRYKPAEALFAEAARSEPRNLWLWSNWGEVLAMQGRTDAALEKYARAIAVPPTGDTNDRARLDAYGHMLALLRDKHDLERMEALYKQRLEEYGPAQCYGVDYARFALQERGDADKAIRLARQAMEGRCLERATQVLGLAQYVAWATSTDAQRDLLLNEARVHLPAGPRLFYELAGSDKTAGTARQLVRSGESIDQRDNANVNALAYALQGLDHATARRLLNLGARPDALVGPALIPVAFIPIISGDVDGVRLLRQFGVDFAKLRYQGHSAVEVARESGNPRVLELVQQAQRS